MLLYSGQAARVNAQDTRGSTNKVLADHLLPPESLTPAQPTDSGLAVGVYGDTPLRTADFDAIAMPSSKLRVVF